MKLVLQRVSEASVRVDGQVVGAIGTGLLLLVGVGPDDGEPELDWMVKKVVNLRIFPDGEGRMNLSLLDVGGAALAISQFTLFGDCRKGRRPSFVGAARPEVASPLFDQYVAATRGLGLRCETGIFQADMKVELLNDGPVTLLIDTGKLF